MKKSLIAYAVVAASTAPAANAASPKAEHGRAKTDATKTIAHCRAGASQQFVT